MRNNRKKIAIFRALQLGDMLCAVPAIRAVRSAYPQAEIVLIGLPWAYEFVQRFEKYIDRFISFPGYPGLPEQQVTKEKFAEFIRKVQKEHFDLIIQMHGDGSIINAMLTLFGGKSTAGSYLNENDCPDKTTYIKYRDDLPEVERNLRIIKKLDMKPQANFLEFPLYEKDREELKSIPNYSLLMKQSYICIHPGARDPKRRWSTQKFASIADALMSIGYQIVFTGVSQEQSIVQQIMKHMQYTPINLAGKLSIGATAALIESSQLVISNCTAISHLADALNIPSVVIYLDSDPNRWAPLDESLHRRIDKKTAEQPFLVFTTALQLLIRGPIPSSIFQDEERGGIYESL